MFLFNLLSLLSKSVFFTKIAISFMLTKFARASLKVKLSAFNLIDF